MAEFDRKPKRYAFVIGAGDYKHIGKLIAPADDAIAVDSVLTTGGWESDLLQDAGIDTQCTRRDLDVRFTEFLKKLEMAKGSCVALLYYSGHGAYDGHFHYMVPTDYHPDGRLHIQGLNIEKDFLQPMRKHANVISIFDACRNQPQPRKALWADFSASLLKLPVTHSSGSKAVLDHVGDDGEGEMIVCWACPPHQTAADGSPGSPDNSSSSTHSAYTEVLLKHLFKSGQNIGDGIRAAHEELKRCKLEPHKNEIPGSGKMVEGFNMNKLVVVESEATSENVERQELEELLDCLHNSGQDGQLENLQKLWPYTWGPNKEANKELIMARASNMLCAIVKDINNSNEVREKAANIMQNLAGNDGYRDKLVAQGVIGPLILLFCSDPKPSNALGGPYGAARGSFGNLLIGNKVSSDGEVCNAARHLADTAVRWATQDPKAEHVHMKYALDYLKTLINIAQTRGVELKSV